jgi:hypothetical protein
MNNLPIEVEYVLDKPVAFSSLGQIDVNNYTDPLDSAMDINNSEFGINRMSLSHLKEPTEKMMKHSVFDEGIPFLRPKTKVHYNKKKLLMFFKTFDESYSRKKYKPCHIRHLPLHSKQRLKMLVIGPALYMRDKYGYNYEAGSFTFIRLKLFGKFSRAIMMLLDYTGRCVAFVIYYRNRSKKRKYTWAVARYENLQ